MKLNREEAHRMRELAIRIVEGGGDNYPSVDHIVPLAKGGLHSWDNVQLAHFKCNTLKGARV